MDKFEHTDSVEHVSFDEFPEEEEVIAAQQGDKDALLYILNKYKRVVRLKARSYFLIGADHEDLVQEGMIGLYEAIRDFKPDRQSSFYAFSEMCIKRQIISAIKAATRQKHIPLNSYISFNRPIYDEAPERTLLDTIEARAGDPEEMLIDQEDLMNIEAHMQKVLSPFERDVLNLFIDGRSYQEISEQLGKHQKAVDNALQRIKKKTKRYLRETKNQANHG